MDKDWFWEKIKAYGSRPAIVALGRSHTYEDLYNRVDEFKKSINEIEKGEVVAILSDYSFDSVALFFALKDNKNIIVPITNQVQEEIDERIIESNSSFVLSLHKGKLVIKKNIDKSEEVHSFVQGLVDDERSGLILFSSGSTGKPKTMLHDLEAMMEMYKERKAKRFCFLVFLMFDHIGGLNTLFNCLSMGTKIVFPENRDAKYICNLIEKEQIHILPTSPTFLNLILISQAYLKNDLSSLKMITYGTEPMPESLLVKLKQVFPKVKLLQTFGTSETGILQARSKSSESTHIKIKDPNTEYKIVNGELWLKSKTRIVGYLNASMEQFTNDGWYKTGDLVEEMEGDYIKIIGRIQELINIGGQKVLPLEVEAVLLELDEIADCLVYPANNTITGQSVVADVQLVNELTRKDATRLIRKHCKSKLDAYKIPTKIYFLDNISFINRYKKDRKIVRK